MHAVYDNDINDIRVYNYDNEEITDPLIIKMVKEFMREDIKNGKNIRARFNVGLIRMLKINKASQQRYESNFEAWVNTLADQEA